MTNATISYVVKDELTLGYIDAKQPKLMGVLSSKIGGHNPIDGTVSVFGSKIRPATMNDFDSFRVVVPSDFL